MTSHGKLQTLLSSTPRRALALFAAVGTITGAIAGVLALLPKPQPQPDMLVAHIEHVMAYPEMSLEQYDARARPAIVGASHTASSGAVAYKLAAARTPVTSAGSASAAGAHDGASATAARPTAQGVGKGGPTRTTPSTPTTPSTRTAPTTSTGPEKEEEHPPKPQGDRKTAVRPGARIQRESPEIPYPQEQRVAPGELAAQAPQEVHSTGGALISNGDGAPKREVQAVMRTLAAAPAGEAQGQAPRVVLSKRCASGECAATQEVERALTDDPNPVKAAKAVAAAFKNSRAEIVDKRLYPIGAMVTYDVSLSGFAHKATTLEWSLIGRASRRPLPKPWWRNIVVAHIRPVVDDESLSGTFWVPVPPERGDYLVHLVLVDSRGVAHASSDSEPAFH